MTPKHEFAILYTILLLAGFVACVFGLLSSQPKAIFLVVGGSLVMGAGITSLFFLAIKHD